MRKFTLWQGVLGCLLLIQLLCCLPARAAGNFGPVTGTITDNNGKPLSGVTIIVKGQRKGVSSDATGTFTIDAKNGDVLVFSMIGYKTQEVRLGTQTTVTVELEPSSLEMTEVVVTALGIKKQARALGYSTTQVDGSLLTGSREINVGNALTGQVAGVNVAGDATGPYGSSRVIIRGNASLSGNNQPLYVIDGVPFDNTNQGQSGQWGGADLGDGLSNINPDDIESIQVLKGVAASALYGYRGGNGAILITTKSGARTKGIGVEVNNNATLNQVIDDRDYQYTYGQGVLGVKPTTQSAALGAPQSSWGAKLDGSDAVNFLGNTVKYSPQKDNFKNFFKTGLTNQTSVALTGSNDKGHFRLGLSDLYLGTVVPNSNMKQQVVNFNSQYNITKKLQMTLTANYIFENVKNRASFSDAPGNVIAAPIYLANSFDIRWMKDNQLNPDGTELLPGLDSYFENPYYIAYQYQNKTARNRLTGALTLKYNILDWLYVQGQVQRDGYIFDVTQITPSGVPYTRSDGIHGGNMTQYEENYHELNWSGLLGMNKKLGEHFSLSANAGANQQDNVNQYYGVGAVPGSGNGGAGPFQIAGFYSPNNISTKPFGISYSHYRVNSVYGSADLGFNNYLFLSATARNDWFSTLNYNTDRYLYPSVALSWVFTDALKLPWWINFGKLRTSYAGGSNGTSPYLNTLTYGLQGYSISGQPVGYVAGAGVIPNPNLKPVKIREKEIGVNLEFLNNRVSIDAAYYDKQTTDDIVQVTASPTSGYTKAVQNIGKISNKGIELLVSGTPVKTRDFAWDISFNIAQNNNKVLYLGGQKSITIDGAFPRWGDEVSISNVVGMAYGQIMGYGYTTDQKGQRVFNDNGEPVQSTKVVPLGSSVYKQTGGFRNTFTYKGVSLAVLFDFKYGAKIYSGTNLLLYANGLQKTTLQGREGGFVGKGNNESGAPNTVSVAAQTYFTDISAGGSDHIAEEFVYDASFIKLRSLTLTYTLPSKILQNTFIKGINIGLVGRNLWTVMKHVPNIDPESSLNNSNGQGLELSGFPATRSMGLNVNFKF
ncbi:SusC/RagA family TonB-linked outer membrane protein [Puia sp.]|jgi:TonB-linked SusC/RagA family outer membrane protein|uniref:SusC/RagA family TonB-linked outer membrane protein n=1 Tax=Puia sp. TaxID=2045100 RepID=UPI002F3F4527